MKSICCFGEVLWDLLPSGKVAGGAPMNVAIHANNLGLKASMISAVGNDDLGNELKKFIAERGLSLETIQTLENAPTGIVEVVLDANGVASYTITENVAWDFIELQETAQLAVKNADIVVFGSLVTRHAQSRNTLFALLENAKLKILDVNLRQPFYSAEGIKTLLDKADILKVNDEELALIGSWFGQTGSETDLANYFRNQYDLQGIIVTRGGNGAFFIDNEGNYFEHQGYKVSVADTVGSGDSFLASFLAKWINGSSPATCLAFACAVGAFVATQKGATPVVSEQYITENFLTHSNE